MAKHKDPVSTGETPLVLMQKLVRCEREEDVVIVEGASFGFIRRVALTKRYAEALRDRLISVLLEMNRPNIVRLPERR